MSKVRLETAYVRSNHCYKSLGVPMGKSKLLIEYMIVLGKPSKFKHGKTLERFPASVEVGNFGNLVLNLEGFPYCVL